LTKFQQYFAWVSEAHEMKVVTQTPNSSM